MICADNRAASPSTTILPLPNGIAKPCARVVRFVNGDSRSGFRIGRHCNHWLKIGIDDLLLCDSCQDGCEGQQQCPKKMPHEESIQSNRDVCLVTICSNLWRLQP